MKLRLRSPWPWIVAASQTGLAYVLLRYSFMQERLHYLRGYGFDAGYSPSAKVLVVWMNAPVYIATFWTSFLWTNEAWEYSKLPGIFFFWLLIGCTFALPGRKHLQTNWRYSIAALCLLGCAIWAGCDIVLSPPIWVNRPQSYVAGRAIMGFAFPAWFLLTATYCFIQYRTERHSILKRNEPPTSRYKSTL